MVLKLDYTQSPGRRQENPRKFTVRCKKVGQALDGGAIRDVFHEDGRLRARDTGLQGLEHDTGVFEVFLGFFNHGGFGKSELYSRVAGIGIEKLGFGDTHPIGNRGGNGVALKENKSKIIYITP